MFLAMSLSLVLVLATIFIHFEVLRWTSAVLPRCGPVGRARVLVVVFGAFTAPWRNVTAVIHRLNHHSAPHLDTLPPQNCRGYFMTFILLFDARSP